MPASQNVIRRRRSRTTISKREETAFAIVIAVVGFLITVLVLANADSFRFAFAEWGDDGGPQASATLGD